MHRGEFEQVSPGFSRGLAHGLAALFHRAAAHRGKLGRALRRVGSLYPNARQRHVELLGADARDGGAEALAELDLSGEERDGSPVVDADPRIEIRVALQAGRQVAHRPISRAAFFTAL